MKLLRATLETSNAALNVAVPRARVQMVDVLLGISAKVVRGADAEHYQKYKAVHEFTDTTQPKALSEKFEKAVVVPLQQWQDSLAEVRAEQSEYDKARVAFDHYRDKMGSLVEQKRQTQLKGKVVDKAADEKLARNLEKLKEAEAAFFEARDRFVGRMLRCFEDATTRLDLVLLRVMQYEHEVASQAEKCTQSYAPNIQALLGVVRDRRSAASATDELTSCITRARTMREDGKRLDLDAFVPSGPAGATRIAGGAPIGGTRSRGQSLQDDDSGGFAVPAMSMASFVAPTIATASAPAPAATAAAAAAVPALPPRGNNPFGSAAPAPAAAAPVPTPGNPFASDTAPKRAPATVDAAPTATPAAAKEPPAAPAAAKGILGFARNLNPFASSAGSASSSSSSSSSSSGGAVALSDDDSTPRKDAAHRDDDGTDGDADFTKELSAVGAGKLAAPALEPQPVAAKVGRAHVAAAPASNAGAGAKGAVSAAAGAAGTSKAPALAPASVPAPAPKVVASSSSFDPFAPIASAAPTAIAATFNPFGDTPAKAPAPAAASWDDFGASLHSVYLPLPTQFSPLTP